MLINAVAPFAGAWIEIVIGLVIKRDLVQSLPSRERGLKCAGMSGKCWKHSVAPFAGAWIEICGYTVIFIMHEECRSLRGSVD